MSAPAKKAVSVKAEPQENCALCPRLAQFRADNQKQYPDFFNRPVPGFGQDDAAFLIIGLAPGLKGANWSGRPFTGDYAGDLLYQMLERHGFSKGQYARSPDDGLTLKDCKITNAVRCVPPQNKPTSAEIHQCRPFLSAQITRMKTLRVILCLGRIAHDSALRALGLSPSAYAFGHGHIHALEKGIFLIDSYHCSRYNVNTGRLSEAMFSDVLALCRAHLKT